MTLGKKISEKLRNPRWKDIAKSEFLLLKAIAEYGPISEDDICGRLEQEKDFVFMFGLHQPHTLYDELMRHYAIRVIEVKEGKGKEPYYSLTERGREVFGQYKADLKNL